MPTREKIERRIAYYSHRNPNGPEQVADPATDGNYYVSVHDPSTRQLALLAGPFDEHKAALAMVERARSVAVEVDPKGVWYSYGTVKTSKKFNNPGKLNKQLGLSTRVRL